jgi:hypothetical protein
VRAQQYLCQQHNERGVAVAAKWLMGDIKEKLIGYDRGGRDRGLIERLSLAQGFF